MARICFIICNHTSAMISAVTFAKKLVDVGHKVSILANDDSCQSARENGLEAIAYGNFTERSAPTGFRVAFNDGFKHWLPPSADYLNKQNEVFEKLTKIQQNGKFDLAIVDTMISFPYILSSLIAGVPVVRFSPNLASSSNKYYPAISSTVTPRKKNSLYKFQSRVSRWQRNACVIPPLVAFRWTSLFACDSDHYRNWQKQIKKKGKKLSLFEYGLTVNDIPELVAAPAAFEFPSLLDINPKRIYIGACVDPDRDQNSHSVLNTFDDRPLIYCAMGTFSKRYSHAKFVFETIIQFARKNPKYNFLIQRGEIEIQSESLPQHIRIESFVPQIEAIRRSSAMITHGGLGSVREASYFGIPMLVIPGWNDQYGNAARIDFHGTGIRLSPKQLSINTLTKLLPILLNEDGIKRQAIKMKEAFQLQGNCEPGIEAIDQIIKQTIKF